MMSSYRYKKIIEHLFQFFFFFFKRTLRSDRKYRNRCSCCCIFFLYFSLFNFHHFVQFVVPTDVIKSGTSIAVSSRYSINRNERNTDKRYLWLVGGWNFCSVSCGGGIRRKMIACKDDKTGRIVSRRKCAFLPKPFLKMETCNIQSCDYKWLPGPWETCSVTCGNFGIQTRQLHCVRSSYNESEIISSNELEAYRIILRPSLCMDHQRPSIEQECNRIAC